MSRKKAVLILDPRRRDAQLDYIRERCDIIDASDDTVWTAVTEEQVPRFAEQHIIVQFYDEADLIELPAVVFDPSQAQPEPAVPWRLVIGADDQRKHYHLVQFIAPPNPEWIEYISQMQHGIYVQALENLVAVFKLTALQAADVAAQDFVSWVAPYHPAYAIHFSLLGHDSPLAAAEMSRIDVQLPEPDSVQGNIQLRLFDDVEAATLHDAVTDIGATIIVESETGFVLSVSADQFAPLMAIPGIFAVEPYVPPDLSNSNGGIILGVDQVRTFRNVDFMVNLDGLGEIAAVIDNGLDNGSLPLNHNDLEPPVVPPPAAGNSTRVRLLANINNPGVALVAPNTVPDPPAGQPMHGTHVTGTIAGDGNQSAGRMRGMAPACHMIFHGPLPPNTPAAVAGFRAAHNLGARVHNNSWGTSMANVCGGVRRAMPTNNTYRVGMSNLLDLFCFTHPESLVLFASGNNEMDVAPVGGDGTTDSTYLSFESTAKNVLTIGASESRRNNDGFANNYNTFFAPPVPPAPCPAIPPRWNNAGWNALANGAAAGFTLSDNAGQVALFSCRGIVTTAAGAATQRVKPDLVAPGTNIMSLRSSQNPPPSASPGYDPTTENVNAYCLLQGTSMATPHVAGAAILVRQYYRARFDQLRRPRLLDTLGQLVGTPSITSAGADCVMAWLQHDTGTGNNTITVARCNRQMALLANPTALIPNLTSTPPLSLAQHGQNSLLLYRNDANDLQLTLYDPNFAPVNTFGTNGTFTPTVKSRNEVERPPALYVNNDEVAVTWHQTGTNNLVFQRFPINNNQPIDANAIQLGTATQTSPHAYIVFTGTHYAVIWVFNDSGTYRLRLRLISTAGATVGGIIELTNQASIIRDPHFVWDARQNRFLAIWVSEQNHAGGDLYRLTLDQNGAAIGAPSMVSNVNNANTMRRPQLHLHADHGYALLWEDNSQTNAHDVYLTLLNDMGQPDRLTPDPLDPGVAAGRGPRALLRISDTLNNTSGFSAISDSEGIGLIWLSSDEINSDLLGAYALNVTRDGAFQAQATPNIPLIQSGEYVNHTLREHNIAGLTHGVSMACTGGRYFYLSGGPGPVLPQLHLLRTNADGQIDASYGGSGSRVLNAFDFSRVEMHWTGRRLICINMGRLMGPNIYLLDLHGEPVNSFGQRGERQLADPDLALPPDFTPQLGHYTRPAFRVVVAYVSGLPNDLRIRYAVLNRRGNNVVAPRRLTTISGVARHGWFHFVNGEGRSIAIWHRETAGRMAVFINRYSPGGSPQHANDTALTGLVGDSMLAMIALRPTTINNVQREYGVVWQYRANAGEPWEIRFSRLERDGQPMGPLAPPAPAVTDVQVIHPAANGWPADTHALAPQLVNSFTHEPWANPPAGASPPQWSPGYGFAWLGQSTGGGRHTLYFTVLDENGIRAQIPQPPPNAPVTAPLLQVSDTNVDVLEFKLSFNGRVFHLVWTEAEGNIRRTRRTALTRHGSRRVYDMPSAALLRATLLNGATNINRLALPDVTQGYGWGRINLRQSLIPSPPVTYHVRDDNAVGRGQTITYEFALPPNTILLRSMLCWQDAPGARLVNRIHLRIEAPNGNTYYGNIWDNAPNAWQSRRITAADSYQTIHNAEQVVIANPPAGNYRVSVVAERFPFNGYNQFRAQPFSLVFVGSSNEATFPNAPIPAGRVY